MRRFFRVHTGPATFQLLQPSKRTYSLCNGGLTRHLCARPAEYPVVAQPANLEVHLKRLASQHLHLREHCSSLVDLVQQTRVGDTAEALLQGAVLALIDRIWHEAVSFTHAGLFSERGSLLRAVFPEGFADETSELELESTVPGMYCAGPAVSHVEHIEASTLAPNRYSSLELDALVNRVISLADALGAPIGITALNRLLVLRGIESLEGAWMIFNAISARGISPNPSSLWLLALVCIRHGKTHSALPIVMLAWVRGFSIPEPLAQELVDQCAKVDLFAPSETPDVAPSQRDHVRSLRPTHEHIFERFMQLFGASSTKPSPATLKSELEHLLATDLLSTDLLQNFAARRETAERMTLLVSHLVGLQLEELQRSLSEIKVHRRALSKRTSTHQNSRALAPSAKTQSDAESLEQGPTSLDNADVLDSADKRLLGAAATVSAAVHELLPASSDEAASSHKSLSRTLTRGNTDNAVPRGNTSVLVTASDALDGDFEDEDQDDDESAALDDEDDDESDAFSGSSEPEDDDSDDSDVEDVQADDSEDSEGEDDSAADALDQLEAGVEVNVETGQQTAVIVSPSDGNSIVARLGELDPTTGFSQAVAELASRRQRREARDERRRQCRANVHAVLAQRRLRILQRRHRPAAAPLAPASPPHEQEVSEDPDADDSETEAIYGRLAAQAQAVRALLLAASSSDSVASEGASGVDLVGGGGRSDLSLDTTPTPLPALLRRRRGAGGPASAARPAAGRARKAPSPRDPEALLNKLLSEDCLPPALRGVASGSGGPRTWAMHAAAYEDVRLARAAAEVPLLVEAAWSALRSLPRPLLPPALHPEDAALLTQRLTQRAEFASRHRLFDLEVASTAGGGGFLAAVAARRQTLQHAGSEAPGSEAPPQGSALYSALAHSQLQLQPPSSALHTQVGGTAAPELDLASDAPRLSPVRLLHLVNVGLAQAGGRRLAEA